MKSLYRADDVIKMLVASSHKMLGLDNQLEQKNHPNHK